MRGIFLIAVFGSALCAGCGGNGGGSSPAAPVSMSVSPATGQTIKQGASLSISAAVFPQFGQGVAWSVLGPGALTFQPMSPTTSTVTYTAPVGVTDYTYAVVTATSIDNPSISASLPFTVLPANAFPNVQPVNVDGGPVPGQVYPNGAFTSVTICTPGTLNCTTINGILVDTGSSGLRILASALPPLPALTDQNGGVINECVQSADQSYIWGTVELADVRIAGEAASSISIHALADPTSFSIPSACTSGSAGADRNSQQALGANGILGVGLEPQDCGNLCVDGSPPVPAYYSCTDNSCSPSLVQLAQQVSHPALFFTKDNNGVALQFPPLSGSAPTLSGSLVFGIGTETNNTLGNATIFTVDLNDHFITNLASTGQSLTSSFIDSSSSGFFFPDDSIPTCSDNAFFCPATLTPLTGVTVAANTEQGTLFPLGQGTINFSVDNADNLLGTYPTNAAISTLAGPNGSGSCSGGTGACSFDWGFPFFYGRNVFVAIRGQSVPSSAPPSPWWAYTTNFVTQ